MDLSAGQQRVVDHRAGPARVAGGFGAGKTTALVARFLRLAAEVGAAAVLVLCRHRGAAERFRAAVLPHLPAGVGRLAVTTVHGLAFDVLVRAGADLRLAGRAEQRALVRSLLAREAGDPRRWPTLHAWVGRRAFADEVGGALLALRGSLLRPDEVRARAAAAGVAARWEELLAFAGRHRTALEERGWTDEEGLLAAAAARLAEAGAAGAGFRHLLIDDYEAATAATAAMVEALAAGAESAVVAGNPGAAIGSQGGQSPSWLARFPGAAVGDLPAPVAEIALGPPFRSPAARDLVLCRHPSVEPEAVAGALLAARSAGVSWSGMAVLVRRPGERGGGIARALARHGIPVTAGAGAAGPPRAEPAVAAVVDVLRAATGDERARARLLTSAAGLDPAELRAIRRGAREAGRPPEDHPRLAGLHGLIEEVAARAAAGDDPAALAHRVVTRALARLVPDPDRGPAEVTDERALDALVAFLAALDRQVEAEPGLRLGTWLARLDAGEAEPEPWRRPPDVGDAVTLTSIAAAAGEAWHTVVVSGAVEGELPRVQGHVRFFDRALLEDGAPPAVAERRRRLLAEERRLFALAASRARSALVVTAAPEPGVLLSRFVAGWPARPPALPPAPGRPAPARAPTAGAAPVWPEGRLRLSAGQLDTYADCPLRYAYSYALRVHTHPGVAAELGTLVHQVLAEFLDPAGGGERSRERLLAIARERWRDDIARYRPQVEEARRDYVAMLESWWEKECAAAPGSLEVLAVERPFTIRVGEHTVAGRIDRVDRSDDGAGIRVVDYKTGRSEPRPGDVADNLQLATYHLAATRDPGLAALGPPTQLRLLFLRSMRAHDQPVTPDHAACTEDRIQDAAADILAERFEPSVDADCRVCDFQRLCPLWPEGREVGSA